MNYVTSHDSMNPNVFIFYESLLQPSLSSHVATDTLLSQGCLSLLGSDLYADMEFVLSPEEGVVEPDVGVSSSEEGVVIKAHRVIVASRCEWLKRALLSGMKEAIDRRVVVRDCPEATFRLFLRYLYGGRLDMDAMATEEVVELLAAADQYETSVLRGRCERCLVSRVEDVTVFPLLQVADRYSVKRLRVSVVYQELLLLIFAKFLIVKKNLSVKT